MKLYGSLTSPFVRKVRMLIAEKGLACEFIVADPAAPDGPVRALNPLGKVPVLELDDGEVLFDSPLIVEYLDALQPPALIPGAGGARWAVLRWQALAQGTLDATVLRFLELRRPAGQQSPAWMERQETKIHAALQYADERVPDQGFLVGGALSLADLALAGALEYVDFRYGSHWRERHARLAAWLAPMSARPSMLHTQPPR